MAINKMNLQFSEEPDNFPLFDVFGFGGDGGETFRSKVASKCFPQSTKVIRKTVGNKVLLLCTFL